MTAQEKWERKVKEFKASGKSQRIWSAEKGIKRSSLRYWLERVDELSDGAEIKFAEVKSKGGEKW